MLQFYNNLNRTIIKYNTICGNTINVICKDKNINEKLDNLYNTIHVDITSCLDDKYRHNIKQCLTIIYTDEVYDDNVIKCINYLIKKKIKICLIAKLNFDFNKLVKYITAGDVEAISWVENNKKCEYYLIIV